MFLYFIKNEEEEYRKDIYNKELGLKIKYKKFRKFKRIKQIKKQINEKEELYEKIEIENDNSNDCKT